MRNILTLVGSLATILLFMLAVADGNPVLFERYLKQLVTLNVVMVVALAALVITRLLRLRRQVRARVFGSRLAWRLTLMFSLVAVLPGALVFTLSVQFLAKSIETWFDVRVDSALDSTFTLVTDALDYSLEDQRKKAEFISGEIAGDTGPAMDLRQSLLNERLSRLREQYAIADISLIDVRGKVWVHQPGLPGKSTTASTLMPERAVLLQVVAQKPYSALETTPDYGLAWRVIVPVNPVYSPHATLEGESLALQLIQPVPKSLARYADQVSDVRSKYRQALLYRTGLRISFGLTLTLALLLALLAAVAIAMYLAEKLAAPLTVLAAGTRAVAQGDFSQVQPVVSRDELGILTHSFNRMTRQLADARSAVDREQRETAAARAYLETVLTSLTAGVLTFDDTWRLRAANLSAVDILHAEVDRLDAFRLPEWGQSYGHLAIFAEGVLAAFAETESDWQRQIEIAFEGQARILLVRGARLPGDDHIGSGAVVVFDDVTDVLRAQRDAAWGEVAKRLAHEIRNPLTPIQLAAERLEHRLADKLNEADTEMLTRSTQTIVAQVGALKRMVDEFREYARQPSAQLSPVDLSALLDEVLVLYENAPIDRETVGDGPFVVTADPTRLRQVVHNLLKNAQEAITGDMFGRIKLRTERRVKAVRLSVEDNGPGFDDAILQRIFEPYATTKQKGTGLGLAVVKKIIDEHQGQIIAFNVEPHGACVRIDLPIADSTKG
jgi:nitrogen fixation/metabolism regulation signal transduction histidine kinase